MSRTANEFLEVAVNIGGSSADRWLAEECEKSEFRNSALATLSAEVDDYAKKLHLIGQQGAIQLFRYDYPGRSDVVFHSPTTTTKAIVSIYDDPEPPVLDEFAMIFPCGEQLLPHIRKVAKAVVHALLSAE